MMTHVLVGTIRAWQNLANYNEGNKFLILQVKSGFSQCLPCHLHDWQGTVKKRNVKKKEKKLIYFAAKGTDLNDFV